MHAGLGAAQVVQEVAPAAIAEAVPVAEEPAAAEIAAAQEAGGRAVAQQPEAPAEPADEEAEGAAPQQPAQRADEMEAARRASPQRGGAARHAANGMSTPEVGCLSTG